MEQHIQMIPIDRIHVLNPRVRNKKIFKDITENMTKVGLKRPITVTLSNTDVPGKDYDLVCGQGRLEAFMACGQQEIPAIVIDASEEKALIMSLVENLARKQHRSLDLLQGIKFLQEQGYTARDVAQKTGLTTEYAAAVMQLLEKGEERLLAAVENGAMPISVAVQIAESPGEEQLALQDAYESNLLRGKKLIAAKKLLETRQQRGKHLRNDGSSRPSKNGSSVSAQSIFKIYQRETDRKRMLTRKANMVNNRLTFITEALRQLLKEEHFRLILQAEDLDTMPKQISQLLEN